jgi:hypothetical protein
MSFAFLVELFVDTEKAKRMLWNAASFAVLVCAAECLAASIQQIFLDLVCGSSSLESSPGIGSDGGPLNRGPNPRDCG